MSNIGVRGEQSTSAEISALTALTALGNSGTLQFVRKTGQATFANGTLVAGSNITLTDNGSGLYTVASTASGTGSLTSVSIVTANGFAGTVANPTTTPAITISTSVNGILSGDGTAVTAAATTGSGSVVLATSPTLVTPALGVATATSLDTTTINHSGAAVSINASSFGGVNVGGNLVVSSTSAASFTVGVNGATNPALKVNSNTGQATGIIVNGAAAGAGVGIAAISSGSNENLTIDALGSGTITLAGTSTGNITLNRHLVVEGVTSTGATGTGKFVFDTSPTLTTAVLGSSTATTQTAGDNSTKVATTAFVANAVLGQNFKEAAKYASTAALPAIIYANGSSGVGATLTEVGFGAISLDGQTPVVGDRVLIKNQVSTFQNGIYTVTVVGTGAAVFVLTRALDANQSFEFATGDSIFITSGSTLSTTTWAYTGVDSPTMGTDALTYAQVAGQGSFTAGNGISITGVSIAIDTSVTVDKTTAQTLTNKRITNRVLSLSAGSGTPAINTDSYDVVHITAQTAAITSFTTNLTGTPVDGDTLRISVTDDGTARALTWGTSFEASTVALPTTTVINARLDVGFFWNTATSKWRCVATA